jgi:hypothetical protein
VAALHDPDSGEVLDEQLVGTVDLVLRHGHRRTVVELKTAARKWSDDQLAIDLQVTGYEFAARQVGLGDVGLQLQVVTKTRAPVVQVADVERGAQDEDDFLRTAVGVLRAVDAGVAYPVRGWACRGCQYRTLAGRGGRSWRWWRWCSWGWRRLDGRFPISPCGEVEALGNPGGGRYGFPFPRSGSLGGPDRRRRPGVPGGTSRNDGALHHSMAPAPGATFRSTGKQGGP